MLTAAQSATDGGTVTQRVTFSYDAFGSRIQRQGWDGTTTTTERYGLDGWDTAKPSPVGNENFDAWVEMDGGNTLTLRRISGVGFDENVARQTAGGTVNWYLPDFQQSVRAVIDNSGSIVNTTTFSSTGVIVAGTLYDRVGYTGQSHDSITGFVGMGEGTREYDAATSRFLSHDPKGFAAGDANLYRYVGNGPTNATDPSGQTLYMPDSEAKKWVQASGGKITSVPAGNGFSKLVVSDAARVGNETYEALAGLVPAGISVHETMIALFDGNLREAMKDFDHLTFDKVLIPDIYRLKVQDNKGDFLWAASAPLPTPTSSHQAFLLGTNILGVYRWDGTPLWATGLMPPPAKPPAVDSGGYFEFTEGGVVMKPPPFTPLPGFHDLKVEPGYAVYDADGNGYWVSPNSPPLNPRFQAAMFYIEHTVGTVFGIFEVAGGMALLATPEPTGATKIGGWLSVIDGFDTIAEHITSIVAGQHRPGAIQTTAQWLSGQAGCDQQTSQQIGQNVKLTSSLLATVFQLALWQKLAAGQQVLNAPKPVVVPPSGNPSTAPTQGPWNIWSGPSWFFGRSCFAAGTPLLTPEGSKAIEQFAVGDLVLSRDELDPDGEVVPKVVEEVFLRVGRILSVRVGLQTIRTTEEHPFWVEGKGWLPARELMAGDHLVSHDGQPVVVSEVVDTGACEAVYNLRVADFHTYFVGCDEWGFSVWAHNACAYYANINGEWVLFAANGGILGRAPLTVKGLRQLLTDNKIPVNQASRINPIGLTEPEIGSQIVGVHDIDARISVLRDILRDGGSGAMSEAQTLQALEALLRWKNAYLLTLGLPARPVAAFRP